MSQRAKEPKSQRAKEPKSQRAKEPKSQRAKEPKSQRAKEPKSQRAKEPKSQRAKEPKSQRAKEPKSQRAKEPKSQRAKEPKSQRAKEPKSQRAKEPKSQRAKEPKSQRAKEPKSGRSSLFGSFYIKVYLKNGGTKMEFERIDNPTDVTHSKIITASLNDKKLNKTNWNKLRSKLTKLAIQTGSSLEELNETIPGLSIVQGIKKPYGWQYNTNGNFSLNGVNAKTCLKNIRKLAEICNAKVYIEFSYKEGTNKGKIQI